VRGAIVLDMSWVAVFLVLALGPSAASFPVLAAGPGAAVPAEVPGAEVPGDEVPGAAVPAEVPGAVPAAVAPAARFRWPLDGIPAVVRGFDPPPRPWLPGHRGVDLAAVPGAAVRSAGAGVVRFAGM